MHVFSYDAEQKQLVKYFVEFLFLWITRLLHAATYQVCHIAVIIHI